MPSNTWENLEESSGGLLDDFDYTLESVSFSTDARYMNGEQLLLKTSGTGVDAEGAHPDTEVWWACGRGWESLDGGVTAKHPTKQNFDKSSTIGRVITRLVELGAGPTLAERGDTTQASSYQGMRVHIVREKINYGTGIDPRPQPMPTAFLGFAGEGGAAPAATPAVAPAAATNGAATNPVVLRAKVTAEAKKHSTHDAFLDAVLSAYPEAADDEALFAEIVDEAGIFATANG